MDTAMLTRLTQSMLQEESVTPQDHKEQFVLSYGGDREGIMQLIRHIPGPYEQDGAQFNQI